MNRIKTLLAALIVVLFCSLAADWIDFTSKEGRFKVKFPKQPVQSAQNTGGKPPIKMHQFLYDATKYKDENLSYLVMYCDYPSKDVSSDFRDELVDTIMKSALEGAAVSMEGKLLSITKNDYKEFPGRRAKYDLMNGQGFCYMDEYLIHSRMYLLMVLCEPKADSNASMSRFFNSFEITGLKK